MKKFVSLFLSICVLLSVTATVPFSVKGAETQNVELGVESGDYTYEILDDGTAEIADYNGSASVLSIPSKIDGYTVTSIGNMTFFGSDFTDVTIPDSVTSIGNNAFDCCTKLNNITIPSSVTSIGGYAFENCARLVDITIPDSVTNIGNSIFLFCGSLVNIAVDENNPNYSSLNGDLYDKSQTTLVQYALGKTDNYFVIPNSVTGIGVSAFRTCKNLNEITIPNSVTSIGKCAFENCTNLADITIPNSVTRIEDWAFCDCRSFTNIIIPNSVTSFGKYIFIDCTSLTNVTIPDSITNIGDSTFEGCTSLANIAVDENNSKYSSINGDLYNKSQTTLIQYAIGKINKNFVIPDGVKCIGYNSFYNCKNLTDVTISNSVTNIEDGVFNGCTNLQNVYYAGSKADWDKIHIGYDNLCLTSANIHYNGVTVNKVTSVKLSKTSASIFNGKTVTLKVTVNPSNADNKTVIWKSSNTKVATVTQKGVVKGIKPGTAKITVTAKDGSKKSASCKITVKAQKATKLTIGKKSVALAKKGQTVKIKATLVPSNTYNKNIKVTVSNKKIVKISSDKITSGKTVTITAVKKGKANIKFIAADGSKKNATCKVTVKK